MQRVLFSLSMIAVVINGQKWTEADEKRRINMIKEQERRQFKMEMGYGDSLYDDTASASHRVDYGASSESMYGGSSVGRGYGKGYGKVPVMEEIYTPSPIRQVKPTPPPEIQQPAYIATSDNSSIIPTNWCFHCATSMKILSEPMQLAVQNLLDIRRARFPKDVILPDCHKPANIRSLPKQQCKSSYCQTLVLTEHERGVAFVIRGCAENFGAVDEKVLEERGDNQCVSIHSKLDLRECTCKNRKYCYKGSPDHRIDAASEQSVIFPARLSTGNTNYVKLGLLLPLICCHIFASRWFS
uniref:Uncharacterized protein n=1 Tax=Panagrellus redivivus TaxID=6233 RepID=A0A7E4V2K6_PANRE